MHPKVKTSIPLPPEAMATQHLSEDVAQQCGPPEPHPTTKRRNTGKTPATTSGDAINMSNGLVVGLAIGALCILGFLSLIVIGSLRKSKNKEKKNTRRTDNGKHLGD